MEDQKVGMNSSMMSIITIVQELLIGLHIVYTVITSEVFHLEIISYLANGNLFLT